MIQNDSSLLRFESPSRDDLNDINIAYLELIPQIGFIFWNFMYSLFACLQSLVRVGGLWPVDIMMDHTKPESTALTPRAPVIALPRGADSRA